MRLSLDHEISAKQAREWLESLDAEKNNSIELLKGIHIIGGTLTFDEIKKLYDLGVREFININIQLISYQLMSEVFILDEAQFTHCHVEVALGVNVIVRWQVENELLITHLEEITSENADKLLEIVSLSQSKNSNEIDTKRIIRKHYFENAYLANKKSKKKIGSAMLCELVLHKNGKIKNKKLSYIILNDRFDLSGYTKKITVEEQLTLIEEWLAIDFFRCRFKDGIKLPEFFINQCTDKVSVREKLLQENVTAADLQFTLKEIAIALKKHDQKMQAEIENVTKESNRFLRGHVILHADFSSECPTRISFLDIQNATFLEPVNFCNAILSGGELRGAVFQAGVIINEHTDFRGCDPQVDWPDTMPIIYIDENNNRIETTCEKLFNTMEEKYYDFRPGGREKNFFRSDYFSTLRATKKSKGKKLFNALNHMQKQRNIITGEKNSRTFDAFQAAISKLNMPTISNDMPIPTQSISLGSVDTVSVQSERVSEPSEIVEKKSVEVNINQLITFFDRINGELKWHEVMANQQHFEPVLQDYLVMSDEDQLIIINHALRHAATAAEKTLIAALSSFFKSEYLFGHDDGSPSACHQRKSDEEKVVAAYIFLKNYQPEKIKKYNCMLIEIIYPHYLQYVVWGERDRDNNGNQIAYFRYGLFEALAKVTDCFPDSHSLGFLSKHRSEHRTRPQFFSSDSGLGKEFIEHCQREWENMRLSDLVKASCIDTDIATDVCQAMEHHAENEDIYIEKQYLIAALIKYGARYYTSENLNALEGELKAFKTSFSNKKLSHAILRDSIDFIKTEMIEEVKKTGKLKGEKYNRLTSLLGLINRLDLEIDSSVSIDIRLQLGELGCVKKWIDDGVLVTKMIKQIATALINKKQVECQWLELLSASEQLKLVWIGDKKLKDNLYRALNELHSPAGNAMRSLLLKMVSVDELGVQQKKPITLSDNARAIHRAVMGVHEAIGLLNDAVHVAFSYSEIKSEAKTSNGKLNININPQDAVNNPTKNSFKYAALVGLQNIIEKEIKIINMPPFNINKIKKSFEKVNECFLSIMELLTEKKEVHAGSLARLSFSDCIQKAKDNIVEAKKKWVDALSPTFFYPIECPILTTEEAIELKYSLEKNKIQMKSAIAKIVNPIFIYVHEKVTLVNAALSKNATKLVGHYGEPFGQYASMSYLKHCMPHDAFKYQRAFKLQTLKAAIDKEIDAMQSNQFSMLAEKIFSTLHDELKMAEKEMNAHKSVAASHGKYAIAMQEAMTELQKEKQCWEEELAKSNVLFEAEMTMGCFCISQ